MTSTLLLACFDAETETWAVVCKLANGFSQQRLTELTRIFSEGARPSMTRLADGAPLPSWFPPTAKGNYRPQLCLSAPPIDPQTGEPNPGRPVPPLCCH